MIKIILFNIISYDFYQLLKYFITIIIYLYMSDIRLKKARTMIVPLIFIFSGTFLGYFELPIFTFGLTINTTK